MSLKVEKEDSMCENQKEVIEDYHRQDAYFFIFFLSKLLAIMSHELFIFT